MKDREGDHDDVGDLELDIFAGARVRQRLEHLPQWSYEMAAQRMHPPAYNTKQEKVQVPDLMDDN